MRHARRTLLALSIPALLAACARFEPAPVPDVTPQAVAAYTPQDLGTLGGSSYAGAASADGNTVVGSSVTGGGDTHAFIWTPAGGMRDLGTLGGNVSYAAAVSADGRTVVGTSYPGDATSPHAFVWTLAGGMKDLGTLGGSYSTAADISADGNTVVGSSSTADGGTHAFVWTAAGGMKDLGTLGGSVSYAYGVSPDGETVVGGSRTSDRLTAPHLYDEPAFVWTAAGGLRNLGTLGGNAAYAYDAASSGEVVGYSRTGNGSQAFRWTEAGGLRSLSAPNSDSSFAYGVSEDGRVVGSSDLGSGLRYQAVLWTQAGVQTLTSLGGPSGSAAAITPDGHVIVGSSYASGGEGPRATRWVAGNSPAPNVPDAYLIDFERAQTNAALYSVRLGSGVVHLAGDAPKTGGVAVVGKRRAGNRVLQAQVARVVSVYGSRRLTVALPGTNTPAPQGGRLKLEFTKLAPNGVTLTSLTLHNLIAPGAYLTFYYTDGSSSRQPLGTTAPGGSLTVPLAVASLRAVDVFAPNAYTLDDVRFTDGG